MPGTVDEFDGPGGLCPYLSICEVGRLEMSALQVVTSSMARFGAGAVQGQEQHFYPSSLKFNLNIVTKEGYFNVSTSVYYYETHTRRWDLLCNLLNA